MKLLVDEDTKAKKLLGLLRKAGHDVVSTQDLGIDTAEDQEVFAHAQTLGRVVLTKNVEHYLELHELHKLAGHMGVLAIHQSGKLDKDMSYDDIVNAIANIESAGENLAGDYQSLNAWHWPPGSLFPKGNS